MILGNNLTIKDARTDPRSQAGRGQVEGRVLRSFEEGGEYTGEGCQLELLCMGSSLTVF